MEFQSCNRSLDRKSRGWTRDNQQLNSWSAKSSTATGAATKCRKKTNETIAAAAAGNDDHGDVNNIDEWTVRSAAVTQAKSRAAIFEGIIRSLLLQFNSDNFSLTFDILSSVQLHKSSNSYIEQLASNIMITVTETTGKLQLISTTAKTAGSKVTHSMHEQQFDGINTEMTQGCGTAPTRLE